MSGVTQVVELTAAEIRFRPRSVRTRVGFSPFSGWGSLGHDLLRCSGSPDRTATLGSPSRGIRLPGRPPAGGITRNATGKVVRQFGAPGCLYLFRPRRSVFAARDSFFSGVRGFLSAFPALLSCFLVG